MFVFIEKRLNAQYIQFVFFFIVCVYFACLSVLNEGMPTKTTTKPLPTTSGSLFGPLRGSYSQSYSYIH